MRKITALLLSLIMIFNIAVEATAAPEIPDASGTSDSALSRVSPFGDGVDLLGNENSMPEDGAYTSDADELFNGVGESVADNVTVPTTAGEQYSYTNGELVASGSLFGSYTDSWELYSDSTLYILHNKDESGSWPMQRRNGSFWNGTNVSPWCEAAAPYAPLTVIIQQGFNEVGEGLLVNDSTVGTLVIPDSVTTVSEQAAHGATELKKVIWEGNRSDKTISFEFLAFCDCGIEEFEFPQNTVSVGKQVFAGCTNIKNSLFPDTLSHWERIAAIGC